MSTNEWQESKQNFVRLPFRHDGGGRLLLDDRSIERMPAYEITSPRGYLAIAGMVGHALIEHQPWLEFAWGAECQMFLEISFAASNETIGTVEEAKKSLWKAAEMGVLIQQGWLGSPTRVNDSIVNDIPGPCLEIDSVSERILRVHAADRTPDQFYNLSFPAGICGLARALAGWLIEKEKLFRNLITAKWQLVFTADLTYRHPDPEVMEIVRDRLREHRGSVRGLSLGDWSGDAADQPPEPGE
jgi:hypothetical protein